jgi:hypothetical protein
MDSVNGTPTTADVVLGVMVEVIAALTVETLIELTVFVGGVKAGGPAASVTAASISADATPAASSAPSRAPARANLKIADPCCIPPSGRKRYYSARAKV